MLNKNLPKIFSFFTFMMFFCFVLVPFDCLASNQKGNILNNQDSNLVGNNNQSGNANEKESYDGDWHEEEEEKSDFGEEEEEEECREGYNFNIEEESLEEEDTPELEVNDGDYNADDENYYYPGKER